VLPESPRSSWEKEYFPDSFAYVVVGSSRAIAGNDPGAALTSNVGVEVGEQVRFRIIEG
jgi:hypothetical protein